MNNKKNAVRVSLIFATVWFILLLALVLTFIFNFEHEHCVQIVSGSLLVFIALVFCFGGFYYVDIELIESVLCIKHYSLFPLKRKFRMYRIHADRFNKVEVKKYFGGLFCFVYVSENLRGGVARYPPVGLSAMSQLQRTAFIQYINRAGNNS